MVALYRNCGLPACFPTIDGSAVSYVAWRARLYQAVALVLSSRRPLEFDVGLPAAAPNCFGDDQGEARCFGPLVKINVEQPCVSLNLAVRAVLSKSVVENWNIVDRASRHPTRAEQPRQQILAEQASAGIS